MEMLYKELLYKDYDRKKHLGMFNTDSIFKKHFYPW
jgi:hypothetical protein